MPSHIWGHDTHQGFFSLKLNVDVDAEPQTVFTLKSFSHCHRSDGSKTRLAAPWGLFFFFDWMIWRLPLVACTASGYGRLRSGRATLSSHKVRPCRAAKASLRFDPREEPRCLVSESFGEEMAFLLELQRDVLNICGSITAAACWDC